jgi:hypothetical protein
LLQIIAQHILLSTAWHGLRTPNEAIFHQNPTFLGLGRQIGQLKFWAFGVFLADLSTPIFVLCVPCPCFPLIIHYFYKKLNLYSHIPNIYLVVLGFEFGPQRIRDLAIVCPQSVQHGISLILVCEKNVKNVTSCINTISSENLS